jgi:hypothetical protein
MQRTHGMCTTATYKNWFGMKARCTDPHHSAYPWYGARGITVCAAWQDSFEAFLHDVGERPSPTYTLDRIDNSRGYEPGNVRWATRAAQMRNTRDNRWLEFNGERMIITDWARRLGITPATLHTRLARGWPLAKALTAPADQHPPLTHCRRGHLFTSATTYRHADGRRRCCLTCKRERDRRRLMRHL